MMKRSIVQLVKSKKLKPQLKYFSNNKVQFKQIQDVSEDIIEEDLKKEEEDLKKVGNIEETETIKGEKEVKSFQTETRRILDIVATALYTDKVMVTNFHI
jgi:CRISPR/Cas system CMR-associated protein Cmr5 small subunit